MCIIDRSTGGGIKTTTVAVLFLTVKDFLCGKDEIHIFERSISSESIKKAMVIFFIAIFIFIIGTLALSLTCLLYTSHSPFIIPKGRHYVNV